MTDKFLKESFGRKADAARLILINELQNNSETVPESCFKHGFHTESDFKLPQIFKFPRFAY